MIEDRSGMWEPYAMENQLKKSSAMCKPHAMEKNIKPIFCKVLVTRNLKKAKKSFAR